MDHQWIEFRKSDIHHLGGFAKKDIPKDTRIIEYIGEKLTVDECGKREEDRLKLSKTDPSIGSVYMFILDDHWAIDGDVPENDAKNINHSCDPNSEIDIVDGHIYILSIKDIKKGEEITYNYGFDIEDFEHYPCKCGSKHCVGYILDEEEWPKLKEKLRK